MTVEWKTIEIEKVVLKTKLKDPTKEPTREFYYVDVSSVSNSLFKIEQPTLLLGNEAPSRARKLIGHEDVIFATVRPTLKRIALVPEELDNQICSTGYCVLKANRELINPKFLYFSLLSDFFIERIEKLQRGASYPAIRDSDLKSQKILLPSLREQTKIAYILSTIQKAIEQQDKLIRQSTELKKTLMQKLFAEGTKGEKQKQTEIGLVPDSWEVKHLIDAVEFIDYGVSEAIPKTPPKNGVKIVSTADINRAGDLLYDQIRRIEVPGRTVTKLTLVDGDLLFNWRNSPELIGKSTIYHEQDEPHIFASFILRINCGEKKSHNYFMKYLMNHYREEGVFIKLARRAVNQANYNRNEISVLKIPMPPIEEQVEIAKIITQVENKVNHHKKNKEVLNDLFRTLLHELMTGQRRVHEIDFSGMTKEYSLREEPLSMAAEP